jgi:hypothetical protein
MKRTRRPGPRVSTPSGLTGFRFPPEVILLAVRWYLRSGLSYRDLEELLAERGIEVDHVTLYRWVQRFTATRVRWSPTGQPTLPTSHLTARGVTFSSQVSRHACRPTQSLPPGDVRSNKAPEETHARVTFSLSLHTLQGYAGGTSVTGKTTDPKCVSAGQTWFSWWS